MEYPVSKLAKMSGVSPRTLRYYDQIGLLKPLKTAPSGYRIYGPEQVDALQQILLLKELGFSLEDIGSILQSRDFDRQAAFERHLAQLREKRRQLDKMIENVIKSAAAMKGEITMSDHEKFEGLKQDLIDQNERQFGEEVRAKYGDSVVDESNAHFKGISREQFDRAQQLLEQFEPTLKAAFDEGDAAGELAQKACDLHRQWLCVFYPGYSKEYHKGLGEMYVADERFRANYDKLAPGCTEFLRDAINIYCAK